MNDTPRKDQTDRQRVRQVAVHLECRTELEGVLDALDKLECRTGEVWLKMELYIPVPGGSDLHFHVCGDETCEQEPITLEYKTEPVTGATVRRLCSRLVVALDAPENL